MIHTLQRTQFLPHARDKVFPFFADAGNLQRITPPQLGFRYETPLPIDMREGALIDYRIRLYSVPVRWRTRIAHWEPDRCFVDEQIRGPYRLWVHTHTFTEVDGGTQMEDEVRWQLPLPPLGEVAYPLVKRELDRIFDFRAETIGSLFGASPAKP